jgi:hypothetical protein
MERKKLELLVKQLSNENTNLRLRRCISCEKLEAQLIQVNLDLVRAGKNYEALQAEIAQLKEQAVRDNAELDRCYAELKCERKEKDNDNSATTN